MQHHSKIQKTLNDTQRIEFAKQIESLYEAAHANLRRVLLFSFLKGVATGLGVFLGGTIVVGLLLWILSGLGHVPFVNQITNQAEHALQQGEKAPAR